MIYGLHSLFNVIISLKIDLYLLKKVTFAFKKFVTAFSTIYVLSFIKNYSYKSRESVRIKDICIVNTLDVLKRQLIKQW